MKATLSTAPAVAERLRHRALPGRIALLLIALIGRAAAAVDPDVDLARRRFVDGTELVKQAQFAAALASFEESARLHSHPVTLFNIGACQRALGRYLLARDSLTRALAERDPAGATLPPAFVDDARAFLQEIDRLLVRARVVVKPEGATLAVDGRPITPTIDGSEYEAGRLPAGPGAVAPAEPFTLLLDPGNHVFAVSLRGYADVLVNRTLLPASTPELRFEMDRLPAHIRIASDRAAAAVALDGVDVGTTPIELERPAGSHALVVRKAGFAPYETRFTVGPGQDVDLRAALPPVKRSIVTRWWLWTAVGVALTGAIVGTYLLAQPPAPVDGGGLGWALKLR